MSEQPVVVPRVACTVLLLRDRQDLEVYMVRRSHRVDFAEGAMVFPGGRVDEADTDARLRARCRGAEGLDDDALTLRVAAIRETFEEAGVLFARERGGEVLLAAERLRALETTYRAGLAGGAHGIADMLEAEDLELDCSTLVPWARWITPDVMPKRFDTWFFAAPVPSGQLPAHDGYELDASEWISPRAGLDAVAAGRRTMVFATLMNLERLAATPSVEATLAAAHSQPVVAVEPRLEQREDGETWLRIPEDAGYPRSTARSAGLARP